MAPLAPGTCAARDAAARLRSDVIASIGRIPSRYQETLTAAANSLAERLATCSRRSRHRSTATRRRSTAITATSTSTTGERDPPERRPLPRRAPARPRRDGDRLPRARRGARPAGRGEAPGRDLAGDDAFRAAVPPRGPARRAALASERGRRLRRRRDRRGRPYIVMEYVPGATLAELEPRGADAGGRAGGRRRAPASHTRTPRGSSTATSSRRTCSCATTGRSRSPTSGSPRRRGDRAHAGRDGARHGRLPLARAGARRGGDRGRRRLLARRRALRAAHRPAAVRVRVAGRSRAKQSGGGDRAGRRARARSAARRRGRRHALARAQPGLPAGLGGRARAGARRRGRADGAARPRRHATSPPQPRLWPALAARCSRVAAVMLGVALATRGGGSSRRRRRGRPSVRPIPRGRERQEQAREDRGVAAS